MNSFVLTQSYVQIKYKHFFKQYDDKNQTVFFLLFHLQNQLLLLLFVLLLYIIVCTYTSWSSGELRLKKKTDFDTDLWNEIRELTQQFCRPVGSSPCALTYIREMLQLIGDIDMVCDCILRTVDYATIAKEIAYAGCLGPALHRLDSGESVATFFITSTSNDDEPLTTPIPTETKTKTETPPQLITTYGVGKRESLNGSELNSFYWKILCREGWSVATTTTTTTTTARGRTQARNRCSSDDLVSNSTAAENASLGYVFFTPALPSNLINTMRLKNVFARDDYDKCVQRIDSNCQTISDNVRDDDDTNKSNKCIRFAIQGFGGVLDMLRHCPKLIPREFLHAHHWRNEKYTMFQHTSLTPTKNNYNKSKPHHPKVAKKKSSDPQFCPNCGVTSTPYWRKCLLTGRLMCNACALYVKAHGKQRPGVLRQQGNKTTTSTAFIATTTTYFNTNNESNDSNSNDNSNDNSRDERKSVDSVAAVVTVPLLEASSSTSHHHHHHQQQQQQQAHISPSSSSHSTTGTGPPPVPHPVHPASVSVSSLSLSLSDTPPPPSPPSSPVPQQSHSHYVRQRNMFMNRYAGGGGEGGAPYSKTIQGKCIATDSEFVKQFWKPTPLLLSCIPKPERCGGEEEKEKKIELNNKNDNSNIDIHYIHFGSSNRRK